MLLKDDPKRLVAEFIIGNQYCTAEAVVSGLKEHLSRVPIYAALKELEKQGIVRDKSTNRRDDTS